MSASPLPSAVAGTDGRDAQPVSASVPEHDQRRQVPVDEVLANGRPRRVRLGRRSLTVRLVTGVVALVVVLVGAIGTTTYFALSNFLYTRFDVQLASAATQNADYFDNCLRTAQPTGRPREFRCQTGPQTQQEWVGAIATRTGVLYTFESYQPNDLQALELSQDQITMLISNPETVLTVEVDGNELRVVGRVASGGGAVVATGLSTDEVTRTLNRLILAEVIIGLAAVALALGATSWGVRRSLRNLYRVTGTAQEVAAELSSTGAGLDRRVPVTEEGTEVGQLAESMNTLLAAVEAQFAARLESEQRMRQFLADASHELRTPLTSIRGYAELARMQRRAGSTEQDNLDRIESEGTRMSRLVDDLLLLARGDSADSVLHAERVPVNLAELLDDAVSGSRAAFPERPIELHVGAVPTVVGDRDQLLRVIRNLITNAAIHTEVGRLIDVRGYPGDGGAVVTVADGGPGLPPDQAAHVFERFWRADKARTRVRGGSGLGLSIVAAVVRAHGGSVRFDSDVATGSTVTVWLPAAPAAAE